VEDHQVWALPGGLLERRVTVGRVCLIPPRARKPDWQGELRKSVRGMSEKALLTDWPGCSPRRPVGAAAIRSSGTS
jgi:hypothetical protein